MSRRFSVEEESDYGVAVSAAEEIRSSSGMQTADTMEETEAMEDNNNDDDDDESITPSQLVKQITIAWQNEICAPRLLPHM